MAAGFSGPFRAYPAGRPAGDALAVSDGRNGLRGRASRFAAGWPDAGSGCWGRCAVGRRALPWMLVASTGCGPRPPGVRWPGLWRSSRCAGRQSVPWARGISKRGSRGAAEGTNGSETGVYTIAGPRLVRRMSPRDWIRRSSWLASDMPTPASFASSETFRPGRRMTCRSKSSRTRPLKTRQVRQRVGLKGGVVMASPIH